MTYKGTSRSSGGAGSVGPFGGSGGALGLGLGLTLGAAVGGAAVLVYAGDSTEESAGAGFELLSGFFSSVIRVLSDPVQRALSPRIRVADDQNQEKHHHLDQTKQ